MVRVPSSIVAAQSDSPPPVSVPAGASEPAVVSVVASEIRGGVRGLGRVVVAAARGEQEGADGEGRNEASDGGGASHEVSLVLGRRAVTANVHAGLKILARPCRTADATG